MVIEKEKENMNYKIPTLQELLEAGVHFGHQVRRGNPRMGQYIFGVREGVHIINLEDSERMLQKAAEFAYKLGQEGKVLLFVGTKKQAQPIVEELAKKVNAPYVDFRWIGGLLTNFEEIRKNVKKLLDLKVQKEKGELSRYTKKEQLLISRKLGKFDKEWGGVASLEKLPDALFIIDCVNEKTAVNEANRMRIPMIGIADSNCNPDLLTFPIAGNDDATKSIKILAETIAAAYGEGLGKSQIPSAKPQKEKPEEKETKFENEEIKAKVEAVEEEIEKEVVAEAKREE